MVHFIRYKLSQVQRYVILLWILTFVFACMRLIHWHQKIHFKNRVQSAKTLAFLGSEKNSKYFVLKAKYLNQSWTILTESNTTNDAGTLKTNSQSTDNTAAPLKDFLQTKDLKVDSKVPANIPDVSNCSWHCQFTNWSNEIIPVIKLDPGRFLYPGLVYGPNNQICGLHDAIYLSIRLNR